MSGPTCVRGMNQRQPARSVNFNRPTGCLSAAESLNPEVLRELARFGNRATRRTALRNLARLVNFTGEGGQ